jgi:hypothetical protein
MANLTFKDMGFKIDGAAGTLVDIKNFINQADIIAALDLIEDTAMGDTRRGYIPGLSGTTLTVNGMVNSTTDAIFGPYLSASTSVSKTVEFKSATARFYNGECFITGVTYSGSTNSLQTFSASLTIDGALNRTTVGLS